MIGLYDRRQLPSPRKAPVAAVQRVLRLYRDTYRGFNVRHFHHLIRRDHGVTLSYSFVRLALQEAGLVVKRRARGRHRRRREPRRSEEHTSELQSPCNLVCRLLLEKKKKKTKHHRH